MKYTMNTTPPEDDSPVLDAALQGALAGAQAADPIVPSVAARIKRRLLSRIAESESRHLTVQAADSSWQPFVQGVDIKVLHEAEGIMSYLLRLAPGAQFPPHRHPIDEECVVLEGTLQIGADLLVPAGGFHLAHRDSIHATVSTVTGATIYLRGASPHPAELV